MKTKKLIYLIALCIAFITCKAVKDPQKSTAATPLTQYANIKEKPISGKANTASSNTYGSSFNTSATFNFLPRNPRNLPSKTLNRMGYTVSYNPVTKQPNWVAWHLTSWRTYGEATRKGIEFQPDYDVANPVDTYDYVRSGFDRGHMCPAADNKWSQKAMIQSFLMTNVCPQTHALNAGLWNSLETQCRNWARKYGSVYVVSGPIFTRGSHQYIGSHHVMVPEAFFKVVLCLEGKPRAIGWIVRNTDEKGRKKTHFINTIDQVERITGFDFFPTLPDKIENKIEAEANFTQF